MDCLILLLRGLNDPGGYFQSALRYNHSAVLGIPLGLKNIICGILSQVQINLHVNLPAALGLVLLMLLGLMLGPQGSLQSPTRSFDHKCWKIAD